MSRQALVAALIALALVGAVVGGTLWFTRKNHLVLKGDVFKLRTHSIDANNTIAVLDFRIANPTNVQFVVRDVEASLEPASGAAVTGDTVSELDAKRLFDYFPHLGQKYNPSLLVRDKINPGQSVDRMIAASFKVPVAQIEIRKAIRLRIQDVDGIVVELVNRPHSPLSTR
jgi:hypothetical protein